MGHDPTSRLGRRSIRLEGHDYAAAGAYFVTICTHRRACFLARISEGSVALNDAGEIVQALWDDLPTLHQGVRTDQFVVMPNHVHGLLWLEPSCKEQHGSGAGLTLSIPLGSVIRAFKARCTRTISQVLTRTPGAIWQRNYYERIVRDEGELDRIRQYIVDNPFNWISDPENPDVGRCPWGQEACTDAFDRSAVMNRAHVGAR